jgi:hypothetical protein
MNNTVVVDEKEKKEIEAIIPEIETGPQAGGLISTSKQSVEDIQFLADNIDKIITAHNKIRLCILKLAQPGDWSKWGDTGEIGFAGANRIGATLGVNYTNWSSEKLTGHDDLGDWYRWEMQCDATFRSQTIRVYGRFGSRDKFLGFDHGKWRELHEINEGNIKIAAMRAAKKEGVKDLFGLHGMDVKFLESNGIKLESAGGYDHKDRDTKAGEQQAVTVSVEKIMQKSNKPGEKEWTKFTIFDSEGGSFSTFDRKIAEAAKATIGTKQTATIDYTTSKYGNEIVTLNVNPAL